MTPANPPRPGLRESEHLIAAYELVKLIGRMELSQDEGFNWPEPDDPDDARLTADNLIAMAREIMSLPSTAQARATEGGRKPTHRHVKRGTLYRLVSSAVLQTEAPVGDNEFLALYQGADGLFWVRPADEFTDGRFEPLSSGEPPIGSAERSEPKATLPGIASNPTVEGEGTP